MLKLQYFGHLMQRTYWCWERLKAGGEGNDTGWDSWMASPTQQAWVWVNSRSWWWTGRPGVLQSMGLQRVWHNWETELNWTDRLLTSPLPKYTQLPPLLMILNRAVHLLQYLHWHYHPKARVYTRVQSWYWIFYSFWQIYNVVIHHYSITDNSFPALKILCSLQILSSSHMSW